MSTWIALKVQTGNERMVAYDLEQNLKKSTLSHLVEEIFPVVRSILINSTGNITFEAMLPGYILVKTREFTNHLWHFLSNASGVYYILKGRVTDDEVARLRSHCTQEVEVKIANAEALATLMRKFKELIHKKRNNQSVLRLPLRIARELFIKASRLLKEPVSDRKIIRLMLESVQLAM
jgi:transcription antitermination factor NusG